MKIVRKYFEITRNKLKLFFSVYHCNPTTSRVTILDDVADQPTDGCTQNSQKAHRTPIKRELHRVLSSFGKRAVI